jgi:hypothetical protein
MHTLQQKLGLSPNECGRLHKLVARPVSGSGEGVGHGEVDAQQFLQAFSLVDRSACWKSETTRTGQLESYHRMLRR